MKSLRTIVVEGLHTRRKSLAANLAEVEAGLQSVDAALLDMPNFDAHKAAFHIQLHSLWADTGEQNVTYDYTGRLQDALGGAEAEFKRVNNRSDIQANYLVAVRIGEQHVPVPAACWAKYKGKA